MEVRINRIGVNYEKEDANYEEFVALAKEELLFKTEVNILTKKIKLLSGKNESYFTRRKEELENEKILANNRLKESKRKLLNFIFDTSSFIDDVDLIIYHHSTDNDKDYLDFITKLADMEEAYD
jgi:hypothetical protein